MRLKPDMHDLLAAALETYRADILPNIPAEKRYAALMIANALAMVERELHASGQRALPPQAAALYDDAASMSPETFEQRLAAEIEHGRFDDPGAPRDTAFAAIKALNAMRLALTNPKRLAGSS